MTKQTWKNKGAEYLPTSPVWFLFDLSNGHAPVKRYVWWFDTKKDALAFLKHHNRSPHASELSEPQLWQPAKKFDDVYG